MMVLQYKKTMLNCIYRSDIFLVLSVVIFFGLLFNFLLWLHEPPDISKIDLSYRRQKQLINEYIEQEKKKQAKLNNVQDVLSNHENYENSDNQNNDYDAGHQGNFYPYDYIDNLKREGHKGKAKDIRKTGVYYKQNYRNESPKSGGALCTVYDLKQSIDADYECMLLAIKPHVKVCLYPNNQDIHISQHIRNTGIWEHHIVKEFQNILFSNPDYGVIDIGANIGQYSLIAAAMNHQVVAVEPFKENIYHLHYAAQIGGLQDKITVVRNAISDERSNYASLWVDPVNHGGVRLDRSIKKPCNHSNCTSAVNAIYMDDLLEVITFKKAVMKVDIEGHEHKAFVRSLHLFKNVFISHIIMEWMQLRGYYGAEITESVDKSMVFELVDMLTHRGYTAFSLVTGIRLDTDYWYGWPDDIIWKNELEDFN